MLSNLPSKKLLLDWAVDDVVTWLSTIPVLTQFAPTFSEFEVNGTFLISLSEDEDDLISELIEGNPLAALRFKIALKKLIAHYATVKVLNIATDDGHSTTVSNLEGISLTSTIGDVKSALAENKEVEWDPHLTVACTQTCRVDDSVFLSALGIRWSDRLLFKFDLDEFPNVTLTNAADKPDMIYKDNSSVVLRAQMPCGHVVGPGFAKHLYSRLGDQHDTTIKCFWTTGTVSCDTQWNWADVCNAGVGIREITEHETEKLSRILAKNKLIYSQTRLVQTCPRCSQWISDPKSDRTPCPSCGYVFCWTCLEAWNSSRLDDCGNRCKIESMNEILRNCSTVHTSGFTVPAIRLCTNRNCKQLIQHIGGCRHMTCRRCNKQFCYVCLADWSCNRCPGPGNVQQVRRGGDYM